VLWPNVGLRRPSFLAAPTLGIGCPVHRPFLTHWQSGVWKGANTWPADQGAAAGRPHFGSVGPRLHATSSPHVIFPVTMSYLGHIEDMHEFWSIWCFFVIRCSWNGRSTKLAGLIRNKHLSSLSWIKCSYVGGKNMHFMIANTPSHLEFGSSLSRIKELNHGDLSKNSSAIIAQE
jgi:hypothetical protein